MRFTVLDAAGEVLLREEFYSIGGGFVVRGDEPEAATSGGAAADLPYRFDSAEELLRKADENGLAIHELMLQNERIWHDEDDIRRRLLEIWQVMEGSA